MRRSLGDLSAARRAYESAVALAPREGAFVVGLADVVAKLGDRARADKLFLRGLELDTSVPHGELATWTLP